jgi:hypothetical protein
MISTRGDITGMYSEVLFLNVYNKYRDCYYSVRVYSFVSVQHKLGLIPFSYCLTARNNLVTAVRLYRWLKHFLIKPAHSHNLLYYSQLSFQLFSTRIVFIYTRSLLVLATNPFFLSYAPYCRDCPDSL